MEHKILVQDTDISFYCDENTSVLNAMLHNGKGPVKCGCCGGACGVCKARIISGSFLAFKPMSAAHITETDKKSALVLLCCVQPRSDLVIAIG